MYGSSYSLMGMLVNGHGGNHVLSNVVQEANVAGPRMSLFPTRQDWQSARDDAGLVSDAHEDMHGGEIETSILFDAWPELIRAGVAASDNVADNRTHLLVLGILTSVIRLSAWAAAAGLCR